MPGGIVIGDLGDGAYKYLEVLKSDKMKMEEVNWQVRQDYYKKVRKVLEPSLNVANTVKAINKWAVAVFRCAEGIVDQTADKLKAVD